jgi:hypothetical protein
MAMRRLQPDVFAPPEPELGSPENPDFYSKLPTRLPPNLRGDPFAPTPSPVASVPPTPNVMRLPEPRELLPNEKVGYTASTPRRLLLGNALQGRPGAGDMLRNSGKTVMYVPEGGYAPPKSVTEFSDPYAPPQTFQGDPSPFESMEEDLAMSRRRKLGKTGIDVSGLI